MRRTALGLFILTTVIGIFSILRKDNKPAYSYGNSPSTTIALGERYPAGKFLHEAKGNLPKTRKVLPLVKAEQNGISSVHHDDPRVEEKEDDVVSPEETALSPAYKPSPANGNQYLRNIQNFINPSSTSTSTASVPGAPYGISFSSVGLPAGNTNTGLPSTQEDKRKSSTPKQVVLTGTVQPLFGKITSVSPWSNSFTAWASTSCTEPKVGIFRTSDLLMLGVSPLREVQLKNDATFIFYPEAGINLNRPQDYTLQVLGCEDFLSRIVTAFDENQHINFPSTLLSFAQVSPVNVSPTEIPNNEFNILSQNIESYSSLGSIVDVFDMLNTGPMASYFSQRFKGSAPEQLKYALPIIKDITIPDGLTEGVSAVLNVNAVHWNPDYQLGVEWYLNGISSGFGTAWNWTPPGNSRRQIQISVRIGMKKDGENRVDSTYPYHQFSFTEDIINAISPSAPALALDSAIPDLINTSHVPLNIVTGPALNNCDSFSSLAITETPVSPAIDDFNIICTHDGLQDHIYSLSPANGSDGVKTLYLWAKDDLDEMSSAPTSVIFYLDQTPPVLSLASLNPVYPGNTNFTLNWNVTEQNAVTIENFLIEFFNGSTWTTLPDIAPQSGALNNLALSTTMFLPDSDATNARFRLTYSDALGQTTSVTSDIFNIRVPLITASPLSHNFGDIPANSTSPSTTITFTNTGSWGSSACSAPALTGDASQFSILSENCSGATLAASGGSCSITVMANPSARQSYNAFLGLTCGTKSASSTLTVTGDNNPPVLAASSSYTLNEDIAHNFTLTAATDIDGDSLTYSIISGPSHGAISQCLGGTADLTCTFTPAANYFGTDSFTYQAYDGLNYSSPQTVTFTINAVNDAPVIAATQTLSTDEDTALNFSLNEATDVENQTLTYSVVTTPAHGTVTCVARNCTYTPVANYNGTDTFTYKANDGSLDSAVVTATITVNSVNDAPVAANNYSLAVTEDTPRNFTLTSGTDVDLPAQTLTHVLVTSPSNGTLSGCISSGASSDLNCTYTPDLNYFGTDSFSYRVCDSFACSSSVTTVAITVSPVNDLPVAGADQNFALNDTQFIDFTLSPATDVDVPAQTISYRIVSAPSQGTISGCIDNASWKTEINCRYTPPLNFNGSISFTYRAYDGIGQSTDVTTVTFTISDKTPSPIPNIVLASTYYTNVTAASVTNTSCTDIAGLYISTNSTTPSSAAAEWIPCTTAGGALNTTLSTINGIQTIYVWSKDQYGNVQSTPDTVDALFDNTPPAINILTESLLGNSSGTIVFQVTEPNATVAQHLRVRYNNGSGWTSWTVASANGPLSQQSFSTSVTVPNIDNQSLSFEVKYTDLAGNEGVALKTIYSDLTPPVVNTFALNNGVIFTANNNILSRLTAQDTVSRIRYFCFKYNDSTPPAPNASCWKNVSAPTPGIAADKNISFNNYYYQIGFIKAIYTVYAWVKDEVGLISTNTNTLNVDKFLVDYDPGSPPRLLAIEAVDSNTPNRPNLPSDLIVSSGDNVFVKWRAEDNEGFAPNPISIEYTLNDVDFTPIVGFQALANGANGACTVDAGFTGCAVVPAPSSSYFKIRVVAKDDANTTVYLNSEPLNNTRLRIIAGNTEHGLGGSAKTAIYYSYGSAKNVSHVTKHKLVVSEDGKFFYLDPSRGLLWVDPSKGSLEVFIPTTGTSSGDEGSVTSATLASPKGITLNAYNNILIWDNNRIRKVDLGSMTISAVLGGGASVEPTTVVSAASIKLGNFNNLWATLIPLPNGDIIFTTGENRLNSYRYRASDQMVEPMLLTGQGFDGDASANWSSYTSLDFAVDYDTTTSAISFMTKGFYRYYSSDSYSNYVRILPTGNATTPYPSTTPYDLGFAGHSVTTGLDGKIYIKNRFRSRIWRYNPDTNTKTVVAGSGVSGSNLCADGTLATSCNMDIDSFFVTKNGRIYLLDQGVVRTIDDSGNVLSLLGQFPGYGHGQLATVARFGNIIDLKFGKHSAQNDYLIVSDTFSAQYREFQIDGLTTDLGSNGYGWAGPYRFETDPATGDVLAARGGGLQRLVRATNTWTTIVGGGATRYLDADGVIGSGIYFSSYAGHTSGFVDGKLYYKTHYWTGTQNQGCQIKAYDANDSYRQSHFVGTNTNLCAGSYSPGSPLAPQFIATTYITSFIDPSDGLKKTFFAGPNGAINRVGAGNILEVLVTLPRAFSNFSYRYAGDGLNFYYCSGEKLYQYNYNSGMESLMAWPSSTIKCKGATLYNPERNTVVFTFTQNGLDGVAEYILD